ncbi:hypothetical protein N8771_01710 [Euryarchaeota archaeon]|nr:hypothetical protein [Euryarchaeota archaeon]
MNKWDVVISKSIGDPGKELGIMNWSSIKSDKTLPGLNTLVSEKIASNKWFIRGNTSLLHGIEDGSEVWAQEIFFIPKKMVKKKYSGKSKVIHSKSLLNYEDQIGLIESVNNEINEGKWDFWASPLGFSSHNGKPCWHIRMYEISNAEEE